MKASPSAGWRRVEVPADRLTGWLERFADQHGPTGTVVAADEVVVSAADGAVARLAVPFPPLEPAGARSDRSDRSDGPDAGLVAHAMRPRRVGVLLVRLGGHAAGVVDAGRLVAAKVGSRPVHGRSAAGGWSQQRFARRREGQVRVALAAAADLAVAVLVPEASRLDAVVLGGDRRAVDAVLADRRLEPLRRLVVPPLLDVPDPRRAVLDAVPARLGVVRVQVRNVPVTHGQSGRHPE